jgi:hypothetical protein
VQRTLRLVPVLLVLVPLAAACGGSSAPAASSPLPSPSLASSAAPVASSVPSDNAQQTISLTVSGGKVTGQTGRVKVALGTRVRLTVTSDVADEIHVHVYDLKQEVSASASASIEFVADKPGVIEVELERAKLSLTRLEIS